MEQLRFTREQVMKILGEIAQEKDGYQQILKIALEALMKGEREIYKEEHSEMSNGYRIRKTYGQGKILELQVPRTRNSNFYPVLLALLKDQEEECRKLAFSLYGAGLTTKQVGEIFGEIYGSVYSSSQISRMFDFAREEVWNWLNRPLEPYYAILLIDAVYIPTRRVDSVSKEAYYTILGVRADRTREVLGIVNFPTESAIGWEEVLEGIKARGVKEVGLFISDSLSGIEEAIWKHYPAAEIQLCTIHLQRNILKYVKPKDRKAVAADFDQVFKTGDSSYSKTAAQNRWKMFCEQWGKYYPILYKKASSPRMELYFTYLKYHYRIQSMLYSTNWIERLNRDYKRTTRMRGALPNAEAVILLLGHVAMTRKHYERKIPLLNYETEKFKWEE